MDDIIMYSVVSETVHTPSDKGFMSFKKGFLGELINFHKQYGDVNNHA